MKKSGSDEKRKKELHNLLIEEKIKLLADVRKAMRDNLDQDMRLSFEISQDNLDKSVEELIKHIDATIIGHKSEEIDLIDEALMKLEGGNYGICEECGCNIPVKRLRVVPFASHCVMCQHKIDQKKEESYWEEPVEVFKDSNDFSSEDE